jgi:predicted metal-dependent HD superfamily phosphohydrolase
MGIDRSDQTPPLSFEYPPRWLARVRARYAEPHRHYHTWAHILACFEARRRITRAAMPDVDLALLFHDAVYEPLATGNEERSTELLVDEGRAAWLDDRVLTSAAALVLATRYDPRYGPDLDCEEACIVTDADLSVLGSDPDTFARYEAAVRKEFWRVDDCVYAEGRKRVLSTFLAKPRIFMTHTGARLWEAAARRNLEASMAMLANRFAG